MAIRLKWKNPNTGTPVVKIYRNAAAMDIDNMSANNLIATITDGSLTYLDDFPKYGETYYYVFSVNVNGREIFTPNKIYQCILDLGPGPRDLLLGDFRLGYFGTTSMAELGLTTNLYGNSVNLTRLFKIVRNGKILYTPGAAFLAYVSTLIANKTFTSGVTVTNDPNTGKGGAIIDVNGRLFAPRVAKLFDDNNTDRVMSNYGIYGGRDYVAASGYAQTPAGKSELIDILRMFRPSAWGIPSRFSLSTDTALISTNTYSQWMGSCEFASSTTIYAATQLQNMGTSVQTMPITGTSNQNLFHAVIEYKGIV